MADNEHVLDNFGEVDQRNGDRRTVSFDDGILTVELYNLDDGYRTTNYRLVEVEQQWVEVQE